ncbi:40S ribosomal protein S15 [[Emmonsia] crescens]|uniref:40S ribosomal protein S15 n=2 Tax=[Emmonsia] crescens TaxID=73230 RepID=A0A2B7ZVI3_9EURO|nr:40S ribosomal protein S15 [Emmonsia crescens]
MVVFGPIANGLKRQFDVPYYRLYYRIHGRKTHLQNETRNKRLTEGEEQAIIEYIDRLDRLGLSATREQAQGAANYLLCTRLGVDGFMPVGTLWVKRFLTRHPFLNIRSQRAMEKDRKKAENHASIDSWYTELQEAMQDHGILPNDLWNMNETGFRIRIGRDEMVITREEGRKVGFPQNRELATITEAISAEEEVIPPFIILKGKRHMAKWYDARHKTLARSLSRASPSTLSNSFAHQTNERPTDRPTSSHLQRDNIHPSLFERHSESALRGTSAIMADAEYNADEAAELKRKRAFRKFSYRGIDLDQLLDLSSEQLRDVVHARARRRFNRGLKRKPMGLIKKLRKAKQEAKPNEKPELVKTHLRDMIVVPEMIGSVIGIYSGKEFNQVEIKPEMVGHYLGEFSISYKPVKHGRPGIGATHSSRFIPLK